MGGTYDAKTGTTIWTMHVPLEEQLAHYRSHPPRALAGVTATPIAELEFRFDGHGEPVNAIFSLACPCGGVLFDVFGHPDGDMVVSPISIYCTACDTEHVVYDANLHGHDAGLGAPIEHGPDDEVDLESEIETPHQVIVRFEFPSQHLGDAEYAGKEPDLFSWITFLARDAKTGELGFLFDEECA